MLEVNPALGVACRHLNYAVTFKKVTQPGGFFPALSLWVLVRCSPEVSAEQ